jgi:predicted dehydrogenase
MLPLRVAFLGCGFITRVHSRHLRSFSPEITCVYASREGARAQAYSQRYGGAGSYGSPEMGLERAIDDQRLMDQVYASVEHPRL